MTEKTIRVLLLATDSDFTNILYHKLSKELRIESVLIEKSIPRTTLIQRRIRKIGFMKVIGQLLFIPVTFFLKCFSGKRKEQILQQHDLSIEPIPFPVIQQVPSVNSEETIRLIAQIVPELIIVSGTRIISDTVLQSTQASFINIHAGIIPLYRGVHGGYWALAMNDANHCGVSVHLVDKGIDTGQVLARCSIVTNKQDNFITYPYLQLANGIVLLLEILKEYTKSRKLEPIPSVSGTSKLWSHPTLFEYLYFRWKQKVK